MRSWFLLSLALAFAALAPARAWGAGGGPRLQPEVVRLNSTFVLTGLASDDARTGPATLVLRGTLKFQDGSAKEVAADVPACRISATEVRAPIPRKLVDTWGLAQAVFDGTASVAGMDSSAGFKVEFSYMPPDVLVLLVKVFGFATEESTLPPILAVAGTLGASALVILLVVFALFAGIASWFERRVAGRMQNRIGPNRVGPQGFFQWIADGIKCFLKEDFIPPKALPVLFRIGPYLPMLGVVMTFATLPFGQFVVVSDLNVGVFYVVAVTGLTVVGILVGGFASANKWSLLGGFRAAAQIVSYEIPAGLALMPVIALTGSLSFGAIIAAQGGFPWEWFLFHNPFTFVAFFIYLISALAEGNRTPFDLPEAESELVSGYNTEYSGMRFVFFFFAEWGNLYVMSALMTALFLGGWQVPGVSAADMAGSLWLTVLGWCLFTAKSLFMVFVVIWLRWTLPRVRIDQLMSICWKYLVPFGVVAFLGATAWAVWVHGLAEKVVSLVIFAIGAVVGVVFLARVIRLLRTAPMKVSINPFV